MNRKVQETRERLERMLKEIKAQIETAREVVTPDDAVLKQLLQHEQDIGEFLTDVEPITAAEVDGELIEDEEKLLLEADARELEEWRVQLKEDIIETIVAQNSFFGATDSAIMVFEHKTHLEAIGALDEVVVAVVNQININDGKKEARGGLPCVEIKSSPMATLSYITSKAKDNRAARGSVTGSGNGEIKPNIRHRVTEVPPTHRFDDLKGRVLLFGGYKALEEKVRNRLSRSSVTLTWETIQNANREESLASLVNTHEIIILISGYDLTSQEETLKTRLEQLQTPIVLNKVGLSLTEEIAKRLRALQLLKLGNNNGKVKQSRRY